MPMLNWATIIKKLQPKEELGNDSDLLFLFSYHSSSSSSNLAHFNTFIGLVFPGIMQYFISGFENYLYDLENHSLNYQALTSQSFIDQCDLPSESKLFQICLSFSIIRFSARICEKLTLFWFQTTFSLSVLSFIISNLHSEFQKISSLWCFEIIWK